MKISGYFVLAYGLVVLMGGVIGYLIAESVASAIMGSIFGAILVTGGMGMTKKSVTAYFTSVIATAALLLFFSYRYYITQKMMPSGMMSLLSLVVLVTILTVKDKKQIP